MKKIAVVTGSSLWEILRGHVDPGYRRHEAACRSFVTRLRSNFPVSICTGSRRRPCTFTSCGYCAKIKMRFCENARYMSQACRIEYQLQKNIEGADVPFLDLYEAYYLSGPWTRTRWMPGTFATKYRRCC
jgi:hypothetical protein